MSDNIREQLRKKLEKKNESRNISVKKNVVDENLQKLGISDMDDLKKYMEIIKNKHKYDEILHNLQNLNAISKQFFNEENYSEYLVIDY